MSWFENMIRSVSPVMAQRRAAARYRTDVINDLSGKRGYDGASRGRLLEGWHARNTSANVEVENALAFLRARSRDMVRNSATARKAVEDYVSYTVGTGIRPQPMTGDDQLDREIEQLWGEWSECADVDGCGTVYSLQGVALRSVLEGGDAVIRLRPRRLSDGLPVPLQLDGLEGDYVDECYNLDNQDGSRVRMGVETDAIGRVSAYHLFRDHPGDRYARFTSAERVRVQRNVCLHLFWRERLKQRRGVPWLACTMMRDRQLGDYEISELERKKIESSVVAVIMGMGSEMDAGPGSDSVSLAPIVMDKDDQPIEKFGSGTLAYANGAGEVEFNKPAAASGYAEYKRAQLQSIAAGALMPYELMAGDLSNANFSSLRIGIQNWKKIVERLGQSVMVDQCCRPIYQAFLMAAVAAGRLPRVQARPDLMSSLYKARFTAPRFPSVDPLKEATAELIESRGGWRSIKRIAAERGDDIADVLQEIRDALNIADDLGLILDSDPRRVSRSGVTQARPTGSDEPSDQETEEEGTDDDGTDDENSDA